MNIMSQPLVSIIMNCYNGDRFLKEAIDSVYGQNYPNWEIIFWDNASTDNSASIAKSYDDRVKYYFASKTTLLGKARNLAVKKASGKYIAFLDCDDIFLSEKLDIQVRLMEKSDYAMCYGSAIVIDEWGKEIKRIAVKNKSGKIFDKLLIHYEINMQSVMIRHSFLVEESLNFETKLKYCPDHNLFMRIASQHPIGVISDYIVQYRVLKNSLSNKTINIAPLEVKFTLDQISERFPELSSNLSSEFFHAYAKVKYYDAVSCLTSGSRFKAIGYIASIMFMRYEYFFVFLLLLTPMPSKLILKALGR